MKGFAQEGGCGYGSRPTKMPVLLDVDCLQTPASMARQRPPVRLGWRAEQARCKASISRFFNAKYPCTRDQTPCGTNTREHRSTMMSGAPPLRLTYSK